MPRSYNMSERAHHVALTREAIVRALLALIARQPYERVTFLDIATEANVAVRTVRRHFASKEDILAASGEMLFAKIAERMRRFRAAPGPERALENLARALFQSYDEHRSEIWTVLRKAPDTEGLHKCAEQLTAFHRSLISRLVDRWPQAWVLDRQTTINAIVGSTHFFNWKVRVEYCEMTTGEAIDFTADVLRRLLIKFYMIGEN